MGKQEQKTRIGICKEFNLKCKCGWSRKSNKPATYSEVEKMKKECPNHSKDKTKRKYFTFNQAKKLCSTIFKELDDNKLQKFIVKLRDYVRFTSDTLTYRRVLLEGGYFNGVMDVSASGLLPRDMWLISNLRVALDEALTEKQKRKDIRPQIKELDSNIINVVSREDGILEVYVKKQIETTKQKVLKFISQKGLEYSFIKIDFHEIGSVA